MGLMHHDTRQMILLRFGLYWYSRNNKTWYYNNPTSTYIAYNSKQFHAIFITHFLYLVNPTQTDSHRAAGGDVRARVHARAHAHVHVAAHTGPKHQGSAYQSPKDRQAGLAVPDTSTVPGMSAVLDTSTVQGTSNAPDILLPRRPRQGTTLGRATRSSARTPSDSEVGREAQREARSRCDRGRGRAAEAAQRVAYKMGHHCSQDEAQTEEVQTAGRKTTMQDHARKRIRRNTTQPLP